MRKILTVISISLCAGALGSSALAATNTNDLASSLKNTHAATATLDHSQMYAERGRGGAAAWHGGGRGGAAAWHGGRRGSTAVWHDGGHRRAAAWHGNRGYTNRHYWRGGRYNGVYYRAGYYNNNWGWVGPAAATAAVVGTTAAIVNSANNSGMPCQASYNGYIYQGTVTRGGSCYINTGARTMGISNYTVISN